MSTTTATPTISWTGASGRQYSYSIFRIGTAFKAIPGNYIFARETKPSRYLAIYIGETAYLSERFDDHHRMPCIKRHGATRIMVHVNRGGTKARRAEEADLLAKRSPGCNR